MTLSKIAYRGTRDFFPAQKRILNYLFNKMHHTAELYGFEPYDGPLLEEVELYRAKSGEEIINEQIYSFKDRGDREVAIRPEMTPTLARMISQVHNEIPKPIRWYSIPNLMRYEKPQRGRLREHWQLNVDIFGGKEGFAEIELFQFAISLLNSFGADHRHFCILINHRAFVDALFKTVLKLNDQSSHSLYKLLDRYKKFKKEDCEKQLSDIGLTKDQKTIFEAYLSIDQFDKLEKFCTSHPELNNVWNLRNFLQNCNDLKLNEYLIYDPTIVRGFDYYTGIVFEIFDKHPDNRRALSGGGAYDKLLEIFGEKPVPGVGFGMGDVTLRDFLETHNLLPNFEKPEIDLLVTFQSESGFPIAQKIASQLRKMNIKCISCFEPLKFNKIFQLAEKRGAKCVSIIGDDEISNNVISIKNLKLGEQKKFKIEDVNLICDFILN